MVQTKTSHLGKVSLCYYFIRLTIFFPKLENGANLLLEAIKRVTPLSKNCTFFYKISKCLPFFGEKKTLDQVMMYSLNKKTLF